MFPNIPCGTLCNSARPASLCAMFDDDRSPLHGLHFWSFRIALYDEWSPRVVNIFVSFFLLKQTLLENLAFPDDVYSVFLIFIIVSDMFYLEMILPSVASCDFARTHPPFLASFRPPKNLKKETLQKVTDFIYKVTYKRVIFDPRRPQTPLDLYS